MPPTGQIPLERYGMTETGIVLSNPLHGDRRAGTVGQALPGLDIRLDGGSEGDIRVKGQQIFRCYWGRPEATAEAFDADGYFMTGAVSGIGTAGPRGESPDRALHFQRSAPYAPATFFLDRRPGRARGGAAVRAYQGPEQRRYHQARRLQGRETGMFLQQQTRDHRLLPPTRSFLRARRYQRWTSKPSCCGTLG